MKKIDIYINEHAINSVDINKFLLKGQMQNAIKYVIEETKCKSDEAYEVVNEIYKLSIMERDKKIQDWNPQSKTLIDIKVIDQTKDTIQSSYPICPTCGSTNVRKIPTTKKAGSILGLGILSNNPGKTYECLNSRCKYKW